MLAPLDKRSQGGAGACCMCGERMLRRDRAERDAHDCVGARSEHKHFSVLDQFVLSIFNGVRKGKANSFAFTDPVFLHGAHAVRPSL